MLRAKYSNSIAVGWLAIVAVNRAIFNFPMRQFSLTNACSISENRPYCHAFQAQVLSEYSFTNCGSRLIKEMRREENKRIGIISSMRLKAKWGDYILKAWRILHLIRTICFVLGLHPSM
jgi:hypothetical protein